jgi:hypothetical protein
MMFLSLRVALVRNLAVAMFNGAITLIILLIAPMGLAGVITNTLMIAVASFLNATACDRVVRYLQGSSDFRQKVRDFNPLDDNPNASDIERDPR